MNSTYFRKTQSRFALPWMVCQVIFRSIGFYIETNTFLNVFYVMVRNCTPKLFLCLPMPVSVLRVQLINCTKSLKDNYETMLQFDKMQLNKQYAICATKILA
jgi:hypothetical protein